MENTSDTVNCNENKETYLENADMGKESISTEDDENVEVKDTKINVIYDELYLPKTPQEDDDAADVSTTIIDNIPESALSGLLALGISHEQGGNNSSELSIKKESSHSLNSLIAQSDRRKKKRRVGRKPKASKEKLPKIKKKPSCYYPRKSEEEQRKIDEKLKNYVFPREVPQDEVQPVEGKIIRWKQDEDELLKLVVEKYGARKWKEISKVFSNISKIKRTDIQCLHRYNKCLKPGLLKGPWTVEEDDIIVQQVQSQQENLLMRQEEHFQNPRLGPFKKNTYKNRIKWTMIAEMLPGRLGKQVRERWINHLDPKLNHAEWSVEEDIILFTLQREHGNKWKVISECMNGRSENAVKNRFHSLKTIYSLPRLEKGYSELLQDPEFKKNQEKIHSPITHKQTPAIYQASTLRSFASSFTDSSFTTVGILCSPETRTTEDTKDLFERCRIKKKRKNTSRYYSIGLDGQRNLLSEFQELEMRRHRTRRAKKPKTEAKPKRKYTKKKSNEFVDYKASFTLEGFNPTTQSLNHDEDEDEELEMHLNFDSCHCNISKSQKISNLNLPNVGPGQTLTLNEHEIARSLVEQDPNLYHEDKITQRSMLNRISQYQGDYPVDNSRFY
eukprot:augustus_masked-scaffold_5-processed-gene-18.13-mRNA-1 protein AED:0.30 eAED:0.34 QI:0/-1/0/1/-1/1/1/0/615